MKQNISQRRKIGHTRMVVRDVEGEGNLRIRKDKREILGGDLNYQDSFTSH